MATSTAVVFAIYTVAVAGAWGLFAILRVHVKGYEEYSNNITWVTKLMFWGLVVLTVVGYLLVFTQDFSIDGKASGRASSSAQITY
jgi:hypothetical protein